MGKGAEIETGVAATQDNRAEIASDLMPAERFRQRDAQACKSSGRTEKKWEALLENFAEARPLVPGSVSSRSVALSRLISGCRNDVAVKVFSDGLGCSTDATEKIFRYPERHRRHLQEVERNRRPAGADGLGIDRDQRGGHGTNTQSGDIRDTVAATSADGADCPALFRRTAS